MRCIKILLLAAVGLCVLGVGSAQGALPEFSGTLPNSGKATSTGPKFETEGSSLSATCAESEGALELKSAKEATFDELFLGCEAALGGTKVGKCTGLTDTTTGSILAKGTVTLGFELGNLVPVGAATLSPEVHFECSLGILVVVKGCIVGTTTLAKSLTGTLKFEGVAGVQKFVDYTSDKGVTVACKLESSTNGAAFKPTDQVETMNLTFMKEASVLD